jgi:hypothetical protein
LSCREYGGDGVGDRWLKQFKIALCDFLMKGYQDVLRWGSDESSENELCSTDGTSQRIPTEARCEHVAPRAVDRVDGAVELIQKSIDDGEELAADALGQETVVADVAEIAVRDVSDQSSEEVENG